MTAPAGWAEMHLGFGTQRLLSVQRPAADSQFPPTPKATRAWPAGVDSSPVSSGQWADPRAKTRMVDANLEAATIRHGRHPLVQQLPCVGWCCGRDGRRGGR